MAKARKKFEKKYEKSSKKCLKKSSKILQIVGGEGRGGEGREGREGEELSFQCLRPSTSKLMAAGKNKQTIFRD
jgi:hypothetical protein